MQMQASPVERQTIRPPDDDGSMAMFDTSVDNDSCHEESASPVRQKASDTKLRCVRKELAGCYHRYRAIAARRLGDDVAADDVVQAFVLKALERAEQLRDVRAARGWLRRLFETALVDFCRRRGTRRRREVAFEMDLHDRPQQALTDSVPDPEAAILGLMETIKEEYADVIYRLDLKGQPKEDAARELGITVNNLTVRAHRARRALRDAIAAVPASFPKAAGAAGRSAASPAFALAHS